MQCYSEELAVNVFLRRLHAHVPYRITMKWSFITKLESISSFHDQDEVQALPHSRTP